MPHVRESIRTNATTAVTSLSTTGSRVYRSRVYPLAHAKLPGLCVYCEGESTQTDTMGASSTLDRELDLMIEAYVRGTANYDNTLDDICAEVEAGLAADMTRGGFAKDCYLTRTEFEFSDEGDQPIAMARLTFRIIYRTTKASATSAV